MSTTPESSPPRPASVRVRRRIEWSDTDAGGHWHYSTTFRLVESAERALHEGLGIVRETIPRLPRVRVEVSFRERLFYLDPVDVDLWVERVGTTSLTYGFRLSRGETVAEGTIVAAYVDPKTGRATSWPDEFAKLLAEGGPQGPE